VGKTTLSLNLAIAFSRMGQQVLLVDADLGLANVDILLGLSPEKTLEDLLAGRATAFDVIEEGPEGLSVLPAASGIAEADAWRSEDRFQLAEELGRLERGFDLILIDTGAGISSKVTDFLLSADRMLVVAIPEPTSIADAYAMVKVCHAQRSDLDMGLLVNRARSPREAHELHDKFSQIVDRFLGTTVARCGHVLEDLAVEQAARSQHPVVVSSPDSAAAGCINKVAQDLVPGSAVLRREGPGLFERLASLVEAHAEV
jgi:flagellar biosynthesis protein FlhG